MPAPIKFSDSLMLSEMTAVMDKMEKKFRVGFLDAIQKVTGNLELLVILEEIRSGAITEVTSSVLSRINKIKLDTYMIEQASIQAVGLGGKITARVVELEGSFNLRNEMAVDAARTISANLANVLSKGVTKNITQIIVDAVSGIDSPYTTSTRIKNEIGLLPSHLNSVSIYRNNLITAGVKASQVIKLTQAYTNRLLRYRANTIARTESAIAVNTGQRLYWEQMMANGSLPPDTLRVWIAELDGKVCNICRPLHGETAPIYGQWLTTKGYFDIPHAHPNCRCSSGLFFPS